MVLGLRSSERERKRELERAYLKYPVQPSSDAKCTVNYIIIFGREPYTYFIITIIKKIMFDTHLFFFMVDGRHSF